MTQSELPPFTDLSVLVAGDVMLDRYWYGDTARISPEAPVPVVGVRGVEERLGGAGNVALNAARLGAAVTLLGVVGKDEAGEQVRRRLETACVRPELARSEAHPTITKLRILSRNQQLIRLDFERALQAPEFDSDGFVARYQGALAGARVVVLSDYAKGTLQRIPAMIDAARAAGVPVFADPKGSDWRKYRGATVLTPNAAELEAVVGPCADGRALAERGELLRAELALEALLVTRGERGMTLLRAGHDPLHLPDSAREVFDVTGAGDTVIAVLAVAAGAEASLEDSASLANAAAGLVVARLGTASVTPDELGHALTQSGAGAFSAAVVDEPVLLRRIESHRERGHRIVMTNGCFDILHAGHVDYLQQARALGDVLVVAVNDDHSVRRLKGHGRPLTPLAQRMRVLAALGCVDYVVAFSQDTPAALIERVLPDKLVKGGDYQEEQVAGQEAVRAAGGEVVVLAYRPGISTSALIGKARQAE